MSSPPLTLDGLARFVAALSTGALPTQRQLSAFLSALIESPLLNTDSEEQQRGLNQQGREIVAAARDAVEAFRELGDDKNGDDKFQRFLVATAKAPSAVASNLPSTASATSELDPSADFEQLLRSIRTTSILVLTSSTLRRLVGEALSLVLELFFEVRDAAKDILTEVAESKKPGDKAEEVIQEAQKDGPGIAKNKAQKWLDDHFPEQPEDALIEKLQELAREIKSDERFVNATDTLLDIIDRYGNAVKSAADKTEDAGNEANKRYEDVLAAATECIEAFVQKEKLDRIYADLQTVVDGIKNDAKLQKATEDLFRIAKRLIHDPAYATSQRFQRRFHALRNALANAASRQSKQFQTALKRLQYDLGEARKDVASDEKVKRFVDASENFSRVVVGEVESVRSRGVTQIVKGPLEMARDVTWDVAKYWIAKAVEMARLVVIPRIEFVNQEWDVAIDGFTIAPPDTGFLPTMVRLTNLSDFSLHTVRHSSDRRKSELDVDPAAATYTRFRLRGVRGFAKDVSLYVKRKTGWLRIEEEGYADVVLGMGPNEGLNIDVEVGLRKDERTEGKTRWDIRRVEVKLENFAIYQKSTNHPILTFLALPTAQNLIRRQLEERLEKTLRAQLEKLEVAVESARARLEDARRQGRNADTWGEWISVFADTLGRQTDEAEQEEAEAVRTTQPSTELHRAGIVRILPDASRLAIGFEAQLLPGKATPVTRRKDEIRREAQQALQHGQEVVEDSAEAARAVAGRIVEAVEEGRQTRREEGGYGVVERLKTDHWKSDAFDLRA